MITIEQINEVISRYYPGKISGTEVIVRDNGELSLKTYIHDLHAPVYLSFMPNGCREEIYAMLNED